MLHNFTFFAELKAKEAERLIRTDPLELDRTTEMAEDTIQGIALHATEPVDAALQINLTNRSGAGRG